MRLEQIDLELAGECLAVRSDRVMVYGEVRSEILTITRRGEWERHMALIAPSLSAHRAAVEVAEGGGATRRQGNGGEK